ncbi:MAG TPA: hypothetical protein VFA07_12905, partial [Chthonomonadaceae bacterium]|nr:hypothetical protein [Chthonomonadaceae bacterium]
GGAGWSSNGTSSLVAQGGFGPPTCAGGAGAGGSTSENGGFGGGGGGGGDNSGGGGGGYSGGGAGGGGGSGGAGGGGGSYYDPAFNDVTFGLNGNGNGVFTVAVVTPAPNAFPVFWSGLGALGLALRKRRERDLRKVRAG